MVDVSGGWIKLYRSVRHNWLWQNGNERYAKWWMDILMMVNHEPRKVLVNGKLETIATGERLTSIAKLAAGWGASRNTVDKFLDLLVEDQMILLQKSKTAGTRVKVLHYADYQTFDASNSKRSEQRAEQGSEQHSEQPPEQRSEHKQEPKNSKEPKNDKNITTTTTEDDPFKFWEGNGFGFLAPTTRTNLKCWNQDFQDIGSSPEDANHLLIKAMKASADNGVFTYAYVNAILKNWESKRLKSAEEVDAYEHSRQAKAGELPAANRGRGKSGGGRRPTEPYGGIRL